MDPDDPVRDELIARVTAVGRRVPLARPDELAPDIDAIRLIAHRHGYNPAVTVAHFLASALARGERGPLVHGWLTILAEAVRSDRQDLAACEAYAAACSVRLSV